MHRDFVKKRRKTKEVGSVSRDACLWEHLTNSQPRIEYYTVRDRLVDIEYGQQNDKSLHTICCVVRLMVFAANKLVVSVLL
jgi:hypothetical protein